MRAARGHALASPVGQAPAAPGEATRAGREHISKGSARRMALTVLKSRITQEQFGDGADVLMVRRMAKGFDRGRNPIAKTGCGDSGDRRVSSGVADPTDRAVSQLPPALPRTLGIAVRTLVIE